jgi:ABC-2 type transport system ATP-binding protein
MPALATYELTKDYAVGFWRKRPYRALDRLTLDVGAGEVFGFLGPNGAGKTTTLKLLMRLVFPTSGRAEILGRPAGDIDARRRIGYLPEHPYFYDYLTAEELLAYFAALLGIAGQERTRRVAALLDEVGVGAERRLQLRKFSKGMLQRVGLAQALSTSRNSSSSTSRCRASTRSVAATCAPSSCASAIGAARCSSVRTC